MAIITLTSDWGTSDFYIGAVKGKILSQLPGATIVDISHDINKFDLESAAFTFRNCYKEFPEGTVHIIAMNTIESVAQPHIAIRHNGSYFIGTDNGVFSMIFGEEVEEIVILSMDMDSDYFTFSTRDRFVKVAVQILQGAEFSKLGDNKESLVKCLLFEPTYSDDSIYGRVVHIDSYENAITNIPKAFFKQVSRGRPYAIYCAGYTMDRIYTSYIDVPIPKIVALFGTHGMLEIAVNHGKASSLCGIHRSTPVVITFT